MKKIVFGLIMTAAVLFAASGSKSYALGETRIIGQIESSKVDVEINVVEDESGTTKRNANGVISMFPGDTLDKSIRIINHGDDCYLRIKLNVRDVGNRTYNTADLRADISSDWVLKEKDTYYYKNIFEKGKEVEFCGGMMVPDAGVYKGLSVSYEVNAIQSANMTVNLEDLHPWGSVEAYSFDSNKSADSNYRMAAYKLSGANNQNLTLEYNDEVRDIIKNFDEIFTGMPSMNPGDSYTESIELCNQSDKTKMLYMRDTTDHSEILKHVNVDISSIIDGEENNIYSGTLADSESEEMVLVGTLNPKSKGELIVKAHMSEDSGNEAAGLSGHISLSMEAVNLGEKPSGNQNQGGSAGAGSTGTGTGGTGAPTVVVSPQNSTVIPTIAEINKDVPENIIINGSDVDTNINKIDYNNSPSNRNLENTENSSDIKDASSEESGEQGEAGKSGEGQDENAGKKGAGNDELLVRTVKTGDERHTYTYFMFAAILLMVAGIIYPKGAKKSKGDICNTKQR